MREFLHDRRAAVRQQYSFDTGGFCWPVQPMANLNKVMLIGNLTRDPELRVTPKGTTICQFSLAVNRKFKGEDGTEREEVTYVDAESWGKAGETIAKYCTKGRPLFVEGRLRLDQWEDKTTHEKRSRMKAVVENFQFLGEGKSQQQKTPKPSAPSNQPDLDEDVPF